MRSSIFAATLLILGSVPALASSPPAPGATQPGLQQQVEAILAKAPQGTRWGLLVTDVDGREIVAIDSDRRFIPASNTKLFTTAAALALRTGDRGVEAAEGATGLIIEMHGRGVPNVRLIGGGSGSVSTAPDCTVRCLKHLIDPIARQVHVINDVIADDSRFSDQRWSPGMSWNNIGTDDGTSTSAIVIDHNEVPIVVTPAAAGQPPGVALTRYFTLINEAVSVAGDKTDLRIDRGVNSRTLRLYGTIAVNGPAWRDDLGLDDPADYAGWLVKTELAARGVTVRGRVRTIHKPLLSALPAPRPPAPTPSLPDTKPAKQGSAMAMYLPAPDLGEEVTLVNKVSQNLHSELMIRQLAFGGGTAIFGPPDGRPIPANTLEKGLDAAREVFERAGIPRAGYDFSDGSGMSTYNRVSPRAAIALLRWGQGQPWGRQWRESFPIGGVDGTLRRRFANTALQGKVFAKTGTLNATNALSGYLIAGSGKELTFSIFANDVPDGGSAVPVMDEAVLAIAAAN